jgi:hypothetical protein
MRQIDMLRRSLPAGRWNFIVRRSHKLFVPLDGATSMIETSLNYFSIAVLMAWVPAVFVLFAVLPARRAVIAAFVIGYLFLPEGQYQFHTLPVVSKVSLTALAVVLGSFMFDGARLLNIRPRLIDLVWLLLCISPFLTSASNDLGVMDGLSGTVNRLFTWGFAYWVGRAYFTDWASIRELAMGIVLGGLAYAPLCWWEIRMSPNLHGTIYGLTFLSFRRDSALFGFRPNVFLANGLTVTMYMGVSSVLAFWAWMTVSPKTIWGLPMGWVAFFLAVTTLFCKALGGLVLMLLAILFLMMTRWPRTKVPVLLLMLVAPVYMVLRAQGDWSGDKMVEAAALISQDRAGSLNFRLYNENLLAAKAMEQPWLGWGGWNRSHVYDPLTNRDLTIVDGLWIILLGDFGIIGLGSLTLMVLGSAFLLWRRVPTKFWSDPACSAAVAMAVVITMYMIDSLFNATFNPVASLAVGGVASIGALARSTFRAPRRALPLTAGFPALVSSIKDIPHVYTPHRSGSP